MWTGSAAQMSKPCTLPESQLICVGVISSAVLPKKFSSCAADSVFLQQVAPHSSACPQSFHLTDNRRVSLAFHSPWQQHLQKPRRQLGSTHRKYWLVCDGNSQAYTTASANPLPRTCRSLRLALPSEKAAKIAVASLSPDKALTPERGVKLPRVDGCEVVM